MMISVVQGGTGTNAQIPGIQVAGKTGTAETGVNNVYTAWFVCFAPADDPKVAVAVVAREPAERVRRLRVGARSRSRSWRSSCMAEEPSTL